YAVVNAVSLLVQVVVAPRLLGAVGVNRALVVMPTLLFVGAMGFATTLALVPALLLKASDGALRHSVHRTATEILYLPLERKVRERFKGAAEALGQRGGQALASILLLGVTATTADARVVATGLVVLAGIWLATMVGLQPFYIDRFRQQLRAGQLDADIDIPDLDLASFETLVAALSSEDDQEVEAALGMFELYGKTDLIPALILYHPSTEVVLRAFALFADSERTDVRRLTGRLLRHENPTLRAAALATYASGGTEAEETLRGFLDDPSPEVRCTAICALVAHGHIEDDVASASLRETLRQGNSNEARVALASALRQLPPDRFAWLADELERYHHPDVLTALASSIAARPDPRHIPVLLRLLARREPRSTARSALVRLGEVALNRLEKALLDPTLQDEIRRHVPRTISRFLHPRAVTMLARALVKDRDNRVRTKILRALLRLRTDHAELPLDAAPIQAFAEKTLRSAITFLHWRLAVGSVVKRQLDATTPAAELFVTYLDERYQRAVEEVFRLLAILDPVQDYLSIYRGLTKGDAAGRANGLELLDHVTPPSLRPGLLPLIREDGRQQKLRAALGYHDPPRRREFEEAMARLEVDPGDNGALESLFGCYAVMLHRMLDDPSEALRDIVGYHITELGIDALTGIVSSRHRPRTVTVSDASELSGALNKWELSGAG
ncbi:MAG: HEAT repeat domain-containing protein, partial [Myxococcota bacterium]